MPDSLQQGSTGEAIQEKIDALESFMTELEGAKEEIESLEGDESEQEEDTKEKSFHEQASGFVEGALESLSV